LILPNFFIIGADKAGTTGLYETLKQHPNIYMSPVKEPHFFAFQNEPPISPGPGGGYYHLVTVWRPQEYAMLFSGITNQRAIGEASAGYMRSQLAARRIKQNLPHARLIAILRHPTERAYSNYNFARGWGEPEPTFEQALAREQERIRDGWFSGIYYKLNGFYYDQLAVYYDLFPHQQLKVYLYEDWKNTPQTMLCDLFRFLEVDDNFIPEIRQSNVTLFPKSRRLHNLATNSARIAQLTSFLPTTIRRAIASTIRRIDNQFNLVSPPPLDPETRARLTADYREDILKLQNLIGRDLSHWLKAA
jgi:hypothetical protein